MVFQTPSNITSIMNLLRYTDGQVEGMLGVVILIVIGMVSFLSTKNFSYERAFGFAGFLVVISAVFLRFLSLINDSILFGCVVIFIFSLVLLFKERGSEGV